ncbi:MAG TPA: C45 family autoproteolytic acyltransferase/hydrolase [Kofleriaceae bacterium]|nr:C45 family autoproteolytic acyltransferase/hydrolase [Kofleriaceae bacterium]
MTTERIRRARFPGDEADGAPRRGDAHRPSLFLARLAGSQAEMGAQHGRLVAHDAARLIAFYQSLPERTLAGDLGAAGKLVVRAIATAWQARLARDRPAELAARSRAFVAAVARHAGVPARGAERAFATMDALQNTVSLAARLHQGPFEGALSARGVAAAVPACSTAIAWGRATADGELYFARNFDFPGVGVWDAAPAFVVCAPERGQRYGFFATRGADAPVVTVVNEAGLVIAPHTRWHRDVTLGGAMIVDLVHAIAARAETLDDAIAIARERPASSSWGLAIGSARARTACVIELAGPHLDVVRPAPGADHLVCTNRYRSARLQPGEVAASHAWVIHPDRRERRLRALIEGRSAPLTARDLAGFLGDRVEASGPQGAAPAAPRQLGAILAQPINVHCVVVAPSLRRAHVGIDRAPCCEGTWAELAWQWDGPVGGWELDAPAASGFSARTLAGFVAPHTAASRHVHAAARAYEADHDVAAARAAMERAVAAAPDDPSLRLAAAWLAHEAGSVELAIAHVRAGLAHETEPYRRGQLLLWGARAADRRDRGQARRWRAELAKLDGDGVAELKAQAARRHRGAPRANLMMADAY